MGSGGGPRKGAEAEAPSVKAMLNRLEERLDSLHPASCCPAPCLGGPSPVAMDVNQQPCNCVIRYGGGRKGSCAQGPTGRLGEGVREECSRQWVQHMQSPQLWGRVERVKASGILPTPAVFCHLEAGIWSLPGGGQFFEED